MGIPKEVIKVDYGFRCKGSLNPMPTEFAKVISRELPLLSKEKQLVWQQIFL